MCLSSQDSLEKAMGPEAAVAQATTWVVWFVKSRCADGLEPRAVPLSFLAKGTTMDDTKATMQVPFVHQEEPHSLSSLGRANASG